jgi:hypothetical protein
MGLVSPTIGTDSGLVWEQSVNANNNAVDSHDHSSNKGVQVSPSGLDINSDLPVQSNNVTQIRAARFASQASAIPNTGADVGELYVAGNELYYNDVTGGHQVQLTSGGSVNATSSGIASGTASAAFSGATLLVKSSSTSFANVDMQSVVLANSGNLTNQLTLQAPTLSNSYPLTLPPVPSSQSFMTIDTSGNMTGYAPVNQGITHSNLAPLGQQISSSCGTFTTSSGSAVAVTNLSVAITTTGRPVFIGMMADGSGGNSVVNVSQNAATSVVGTVYIIRGSTNLSVSTVAVQGASGNLVAVQPSSAFSYIDVPSAGTYTYSIKIQSGNSSTTMAIFNTVLIAYEL